MDNKFEEMLITEKSKDFYLSIGGEILEVITQTSFDKPFTVYKMKVPKYEYKGK